MSCGNSLLDVATLGIAPALGVGGSKSSSVPENPTVAEYGQSGVNYLQLLNAYAAGAPTQLKLQQQFQPQYDQLNLTETGDTLNGVNGNPGYLSLYENNVVPTITRAQTAANTATRAANAADLTNLGPAALAGVKAANPQQTGLLDTLNTQAQEGLDAGTGLTADQMRNITNATNASLAQRGVAYGPAASYAQVMATGQYGDQLLQQRQTNAGAVAQLDQTDWTDPVLSAMNLSSNAPNAAQSLTQAGTQLNSTSGPTLLTSNDASSMLSGAFNANNQANLDAANNKAALCSSGVSAGGSVVGGALGGLLAPS
jgi:hypothetical protein